MKKIVFLSFMMGATVVAMPRQEINERLDGLRAQYPVVVERFEQAMEDYPGKLVNIKTQVNLFCRQSAQAKIKHSEIREFLAQMNKNFQRLSPAIAPGAAGPSIPVPPPFQPPRQEEVEIVAEDAGSMPVSEVEPSSPSAELEEPIAMEEVAEEEEMLPDSPAAEETIRNYYNGLSIEALIGILPGAGDFLLNGGIFLRDEINTFLEVFSSGNRNRIVEALVVLRVLGFEG